MAYNGSGTFVINSAGQPVVSGTVISSTAFNALTADLATGLSTAITKDGQTTITANIPMANYKFTGLGTGSAAGDSANLSQVQSTAVKLLASVSGADTITAVGSPNVAAYVAGQMFYFVAAAANTGAVTINIDSLGAKSITRDGTTALAAGDIQSGEVCVIVYDGTQFQLVNGASQSAAIVTNSLTVNGTSSLDGAVTINDSGADVDFRIESDTNANAFFLDGATGNVGIGTSSPTSKLTVSFSDATGSTLGFSLSNTSTSTNQSYVGMALSAQNGTVLGDVFCVPTAGTVLSGGGLVVRTQSTYPIAFQTNNTERMRITSDGELVVGGSSGLGSPAGTMLLERSNAGASFNLFRNDTTVTAGNPLGEIAFYGNDTTSNTPTALAAIRGVASGTHGAGDNPTDIAFQTTPDGTETAAEAGRITQAGSYVLKGGTTTAAAGVGVIFPATQVASANANSLDDYEEGTWTPVVADAASGGNASATVLVGNYTKIGNIVTVTAACVNISTSGLTAGNAAYIRGLPFASADVAGSSAYFTGSALTGAVTISAPPTVVLGDNGQTALSLNDGSGILVSDLTSGQADIWFTLTYQA